MQCFLNELGSVYLLKQFATLQWYGWVSECVLICASLSFAFEYRLSQPAFGQAYGFSPVCDLTWRINFPNSSNLFPQESRVQVYGFSPVCDLMCISTPDRVFMRSPYRRHPCHRQLNPLASFLTRCSLTWLARSAIDRNCWPQLCHMHLWNSGEIGDNGDVIPCANTETIWPWELTWSWSKISRKYVSSVGCPVANTSVAADELNFSDDFLLWIVPDVVNWWYNKK